MGPELLAALGVGIGGLSLGFAGFAFAMLATAALALVHPPQLVVPAVLLLTATFHPCLLYEHRALLRWKLVRALPVFAPGFFVSLWAGIAAGSFLLRLVEPWGARVVLGLAILAFAARSLVAERAGPPGEARPARPGMRRGVGLSAGVLEGWLGVGGPPIVAYLTHLGLDRGTFIVAFSGSILLAHAFRVLAYAYAGYWTGDVLALYLVTLPVAAAGFLVGVLLRRVLSAERLFRRAVLGLLAANGLGLVLRGLLG